MTPCLILQSLKNKIGGVTWMTRFRGIGSKPIQVEERSWWFGIREGIRKNAFLFLTNPHLTRYKNVRVAQLVLPF